MAAALTIQIPSIDSTIALAGYAGENLKIICNLTGANIVLRGQELLISGTPKQMEIAMNLVQTLENLWHVGSIISNADILTAYQALNTHREGELEDLQKRVLAKTRRGKVIRAKTFCQKEYIEAISKSDLTFCTGPAGTGKTFLAVVIAVKALLNNQFEKLILTRPAVEAGEKLGFLPGDLQQKINPYLRPLYDAIHQFIAPEKLPSLIEKGIIEVAPLAYMRGRTLDNAFVIVDEAVTEDLPDGDLSLAWERLCNQFEPRTTPRLTDLNFLFFTSRLGDVEQDPEEWISELERMRNNLKRINNVPVSNLDLMIHVMNNLLREYDTLIKSFEREIGSMSSKFSIEKMKD